jgi:hypothetical protein
MKQGDSEEEDADRTMIAAMVAAVLGRQAFRVMSAITAFEAAGQDASQVGIDAIVAAAFDLEVELEAFASAIRPGIARFGSRAITAMTEEYGWQDGFTVDTDFIRAILQEQEVRFARDVTSTSVQAIRNEVAEGIGAGEGYYQLRARVLDYYDRTTEWRAGLAAQYESGTAYEAVRDAIAHQHGMTHKRWETMRDDRVEQMCLDNEAAGWIPADDVFPSGHSRPLAHPRCRCWLSWGMGDGS